MSQKILVIDDDSFQQKMYAAALGTDYTIFPALSGREGIASAEAEQPDLIILDVDMPEQNGYEVCEQLKANSHTAEAPVLFVSSLDEIEDRLKGYAAGGADYVVKPINLKEFKAKVQHLLSSQAEYHKLKDRAGSASSTAMNVMTNMSELGILLDCTRRFNACIDQKMLATAMLEGIAAFDLRGAVQLRIAQDPYSQNANGPATPLEISIIGHLQKSDRITQYKANLAISYPIATLLIHNMPVADADRCGRLRDHLAILTEAADARAQAIGIENKSRHLETIERAVRLLSTTLTDYNTAQRQAQRDTREAVMQLFERIERETLGFGLTGPQENHLADILHSGIEQLVVIQKNEGNLQDKLQKIIQELSFALSLK